VPLCGKAVPALIAIAITKNRVLFIFIPHPWV
jgi:hypothetical protein